MAVDEESGLFVPEDLRAFAFAHDVRVSVRDGRERAFFEVTRVDVPGNRYHTDIWCAAVAGQDGDISLRPLTSSGEEGRFDVLDDGRLLFASKRRRTQAKGAQTGGAAGAQAKDALEPGCDLYVIDPDGGEAELLVCLPGLAVRDWAPIDAEHIVVCARPLLDESSPVVEIEDLPFYENGGTYTSGLRWGLYLLDLAALPASREARVGEEGALCLLTRATEDVDAWALATDRARLVFASRTFEGLRPTTNVLWSIDLRDLVARPDASVAARARSDADVCVDTCGNAAAPEPSRTLLSNAPLRRSDLLPHDAGVLFLATDKQTYGVNEDPVPWYVPVDGSAPEAPYGTEDPDVYFGNTLSCDSLYGGGQSAKAVGDACYFLTTEFDRTYIRRLEPSGALAPALDLPDAMAYPQCFDTLDGCTFWLVSASETGLPEVWRAVVPAAAGDASPAAPASLTRVTHLSRALDGKRVSRPESFTFTSGNAQLTGYVLFPANYDPARRYPGVLEIHGGPHCAYGATFSHEMQCLAARGYFVFFTNPHGSASHGRAFADIRGGYGAQDYADLMAFTDEVLRRYPAIDPQRLAVMGGSYGGFMTNWVIGHTNRFRCANSQRSIANFMTKSLVSDIGTWVNMPETTDCSATDLTEDSLAFAGEHPQQLWQQSPLAFAANVQTPTLFLHSDCDYRCPLEEGMQMYAALRLRQVPARLVIFKGEAHGLSRTGKPQNRIRRLQEILAWYARWLDEE